MKKYTYLLMVMLMTLVSVGLTACGDDEPKVEDIIGTWQYMYPNMYDDSSQLLQFSKDGKFHQVAVFIVEGKTDFVAFHGTYTVKGNELSLTYDDNLDHDSEREAITFKFMVQGDRLTFLDQRHSTYIRIPDSVIKPYL